MSVDSVSLCLMILFMIPYAIELSLIISVAGCGSTMSLSVILSASNYLELYNNAPHYAFADNDIMIQMIVNMTIIVPIGQLRSLVASPM